MPSIPLVQFAQFAVTVGVAPLLHGAMRALRAKLQGRPGPSPFQPYRDLAKLMQKEALLPEETSLLARSAPPVALGTALTFASLVPIGLPGGTDSLSGAWIDVVALAFMLAAARFVLALAALDSRSAFAGMAASREATFAALIEPALLLTLLGGAVCGRGTALASVAGLPFGVAGAAAIAAFFLVLVAETARVPVDNQETHYELTMIHEGLVIEYSGWQLAMLALAAQVRQICFFVLAAALLPGAGWWAGIAWIPFLAFAVTLVETFRARLRLFEIPKLLTAAFLLAAASLTLRGIAML
jgi:formate hydrogenlyase subunit 4